MQRFTRRGHRVFPFSSSLALPPAVALCVVLQGVLPQAGASAADLTASDGAVNNYFGVSVSQSGSIGLVGALNAAVAGHSVQGAAYLFRNLDTATGTVTQNVKLIASDGATLDAFGDSVSQSGSNGLVGAYQATVSFHGIQGAAYVFRNLDTATGTVTQNVKLTASDGAANDNFGFSVSQSGGIGLIGAYGATVSGHSRQGAAYLFRNLDTASGTVTQNVKLTSSDGAAFDAFGTSVSQSSNIGLVGAYGATASGHNQQGVAYVFRNLDTASGTVTQNVKLMASDGAASEFFGHSVSQSGSIGLVGAFRATVSGHANQGAAYVFRNLDTASGTVTQNVKLTASDGAANDVFGTSVSQSGSIGLVGAYVATVSGNSQQGAAYLFRNLDTATGTVTQNVKLTASDGAAEDGFGASVSLFGDQFTIGASDANANTGKAYTGTVSSVTTLDTGSTSRTIDGISFVSQTDWIIGQNTSGNSVNLLSGNSANVTVGGKAVYVGQNAGSNNNTLTIAGTLTTSSVDIGAQGLSTGNILQLESSATLTSSSLLLATGNSLRLAGDYSAISSLLTRLGGDSLEVWDGNAWDAVNSADYAGLISSIYDAGTGYTTVNTVVPEPASHAGPDRAGRDGIAAKAMPRQARKP